MGFSALMNMAYRPPQANYHNQQENPRPRVADMLVSVNRHKSHAKDALFSCQLPICCCQNDHSDFFHLDYTVLDYEYLKSHIYSFLGTDLGDRNKVLVWKLSENGQLGNVMDDASFAAAVLDHKNMNKVVVQLYVVHTDDMTNLPQHSSESQ